MMSPGLNLVMTVFGFAVSILFIVFVCTRLICARIHLRNSRVALPAAVGSDLGIASLYSLERGIHGLEPVVVASFPTKKFGNHSFQSEQETQHSQSSSENKLMRAFQFCYHLGCTVCLADYQEKDVLRILPFCGHTFHVTCIDVWLKQHSTCPICRISLRDSPDRKRTLQPLYCPVVRSFTPPQTFVSDPCQHQCAESGFSSRMAENQITVPHSRRPVGLIATDQYANSS